MANPFEHGICAVPECYGPRLPGKTICALHIRTEIGETIHTQVRLHEAKMRFHQRRQSGDYGYLFDEPLRAILAEAGDELTTTDELGAVRYALAKLLAEEDDPRQLSMGVTRLVSAAATLIRTRVATEQHKHDPLTSVVRVRDRLARVERDDDDDAAALPGDEPPALPASADTLDLPDEGWPVYPGEGQKIPLYDEMEEEE